MAAYNPPKELHGIPLSERSQWLLFAPTWMLFPNWRKQVLSQPIVEFRLRDELWVHPRGKPTNVIHIPKRAA